MVVPVAAATVDAVKYERIPSCRVIGANAPGLAKAVSRAASLVNVACPKNMASRTLSIAAAVRICPLVKSPVSDQAMNYSLERQRILVEFAERVIVQREVCA